MPVQPTSPETPTPVVVDPGAGRLHGALDMVRADRIGGWAIDRTKRGTAVEVDIFREGPRIATLRADRPRKDLARGDEDAGSHGFALALDPPLEPGFEFTIAAVARAADGASAELRRVGGGEPATPERRILERVFEELTRLRPAPAARRSGRGGAAPRDRPGAHRGRAGGDRGAGAAAADRAQGDRGGGARDGRRLAHPRDRLDVLLTSDGPRAAHPLHPRQLPGAVRRARHLAGREGLGGDLRDGGARGGGGPMRILHYAPHRRPSPQTHPYAQAMDRAAINAQGFVRTALAARRADTGRTSSWRIPAGGRGCSPRTCSRRRRSSPTASGGTAIPRRTWPTWRGWRGARRASALEAPMHERARNAPIAMDLAASDAAICPTEFQAAQFPEVFRRHLSVMHDGIDTDFFRPSERRGGRRSAGSWPRTPMSSPTPPGAWSRTAASRSSWRRCRRSCGADPKAVAVIAGENRVAYGGDALRRVDWKARALAENDIDPARVHFVGHLGRRDYLRCCSARRRTSISRCRSCCPGRCWRR